MHRLLALVTAGLLILALAGSQAARAQEFKALVFSKTTGFRHASIPDGITALQSLAAEHGFEVVATEDAGVFTPEGLEPYQVVIFLNTTGDVLDEAQQAAFEAYIRTGRGFVGIHSAADTEYDWPFYAGLLGVHLQSHPPIQRATINVADRVHPSTSMLPARWERRDEWYDFRANPRGGVHVLATLDEATYDGGLMGHDHPIAWCQTYEGGRSWYTAGGHTPNTYSEPLFRQHLAGGIRYAAGVVDGDCRATVRGSFEKVILEEDVDSAIDLTIAPEGRVFYIEIDGSVHIHHPETGITHGAAKLDVYQGNENGLLGIALDPSFEQTNWVYLFYTPVDGIGRQRLSRFTLAGNYLDLASEVVFLEIPISREECCHAAGSMLFDADGNLYIALGDDTNPFDPEGYAPIDERPGREPWDAQRSSANTDDLRGKILRVRPQPDGSYTIPEGNLFPGGGGRPEIYVMGVRNPYRITVDAESGYLYWGDIGPDAGRSSDTRGPAGLDEWNRTREAGNFGWPYCIGPNEAYVDFDFATGIAGLPFDCEAPVNESPNNTGARELPPARPAWLWYPYGPAVFPQIPAGQGRAAMVGPVYHYDADRASDGALPPYYDDTLFLFDWSRDWMLEVKFDPEGEILHMGPFAPDLPLSGPIALGVGPEGSLYVLEWGDGFEVGLREAQLARIDYVAGPASPVAVLHAAPTSGPVPLEVRFDASASFAPEGAAGLTFAWDFEGDGIVDATVPEVGHTYTVPGIYTPVLTISDESGRQRIRSTTIAAGNSTPSLTFEEPVDGGFFTWGDPVPFRVTASDPEDGSVADGTIGCDALTVQLEIGHDDHGHPTSPLHACEGVFETTSEHGSPEEKGYLIVTASYTDHGLDGTGTGALTATATHRLYPRRIQAEFHAVNEGTDVAETGDSAGGGDFVGWIEDGDYIAFERMNLTGIRFLSYRVASAGSGGRIEVRADSPEGPLLSTAYVDPTGGWQIYEEVTAPIHDPGGTRDLYFVFRHEPGAESLFNINWIDFHGEGVADRSERGPEGLTATYFDGPDFSGTSAERIDARVNFNWRTDPPLPAWAAGDFSVRWTGRIEAEQDGRHTFHLRSGGKMRLWLEGQLLADHDGSSAATSESTPVTLEAGSHYDLVLEFVHEGGEAQAHLLWSTDSADPAVVPARLLYPGSSSGTDAETETPLPERPVLEPAYPNPFSGHTTLAFSLPEAGPVRLEIFDVTGRRVAVLEEGVRPAGRHTIDFRPEGLPSGLYLCRLDTRSGMLVRTLAIVR